MLALSQYTQAPREKNSPVPQSLRSPQARANSRSAGGDMLSAYAEKKAEPEAPTPAPAAAVSAPPALPAKAAPSARDLVSHPVVHPCAVSSSICESGPSNEFL